MLAACVAAYVAAASIEFEIGPGTALPTTPVLWVSLFLLPPQLVPIVALAGLMIAASAARLRDPDRRERLPVLAGSAWHAVGPALVFAMAPARGLALDALGVYALALGAQFGCDAAASWVRNCYGLGVPVRKLAEALRFTFLTDLMPRYGITSFRLSRERLAHNLRFDRQRRQFAHAGKMGQTGIGYPRDAKVKRS